MSDKLLCSVQEHRARSDCLGALDSIRVPSHMPPAALVISVPCLFARLKHRIIRLRRHTHDDWRHFQEEFEGKLDYFLDNLDTRWLVAVCDTYADYGLPSERRNAMLISLLCNWEKQALTQRLASGNYEVSTGELTAMQAMAEPQPLWDGMTSMVLRGGDVLPNLFRRLDSLLTETPALRRVMVAVLRRMQGHEHSTVTWLDGWHKRDLWADIYSVFPAGDNNGA